MELLYGFILTRTVHDLSKREIQIMLRNIEIENKDEK